MPVRKPSNWGGNIIGSFPSLKLGHSVPYESTIERDLLFFLEFDPAISCYEMQPLTISLADDDGSSHCYTPDVLITHTTGKLLVECKPAALVDSPAAQQQIAIGQSWADENACDFVVVTDIDLRTGSRLANLKLLWRYARLSVPYHIHVGCQEALKDQLDGLPFGTLLDRLDGPTPILSPYLYHLLFRHIITTDFDRPLSAASLIRLASRLSAASLIRLASCLE